MLNVYNFVLVKATLAVAVMFNVITQWNAWYYASIYLPKRRDLCPLQLVYPFAQRYFVAGVQLGGIKG